MKTQYYRSSGIRSRLLTLGLIAPVCHLHAASGTWNVNASGNWSDPANWAGGVVASGATFSANFSTVDITADHVISIDSPFTIGSLVSQDLTNISNSWLFSGPGLLTLDNGGDKPALNIINRTPTISAPLAGTNGFSKTGAGALILSGDNSGLSGVIDLPNVTGTNGAGLTLANQNAIGGVTTVNVGGTATTGQWLALSGGITLGSGVTINLNSQGGNNAPNGALLSEGGATVTNVINGPVNITSAGVRIGNAASRLLQINGQITGGTNGVTFRRSVNDGIHITNTTNSWTGTTTHSEGILRFDPGTLPTDSPLIIAASAGGTVHLRGTFNRALGTGTGEVRFGGAEATVNNRALGLSARGGDLAVNLGGAGAEVLFNNFTAANTGTPSTINTNILVLNDAQADSKLTLANPLNLNGAGRTIQVSSNTTELTGGLRGGAFTVTKAGGGTLHLPGPSTWLGELTIGSTADSNNAGIVRVTHNEALGADATAKNINAQGLNRGISIVELQGGVTIADNKELRMWGKNFAMSGNTGSGLQQSLRNVSGNNTWAGNVIIQNSGGGYAIENLSGTLTLGANPSTASIMRNVVANSTRAMSLLGSGDYVIHNKIADNGAANITFNKFGSGLLTIDRTDNDFDVTPNLLVGTTAIQSIADAGTASSLGAGPGISLGATLRHVGSSDSTSNRPLSLWPTGGTLDSSGAGSLSLTASTFSHNAGVATTIAAPFPAESTSLVLNETAGIAVGQAISGTNIPANTTITAVNPDTRTVTISQATSAASTTGVTMTIGTANNLDRTLTLTGSNSGDNTLAAPLSNPGGTGKLGVTKSGTGKWTLNGPSLPYTGPTLVQQGVLGFNGAFPAGSPVTVPVGSGLSLANLELRVNPNTGMALEIDGNLAIDGPVNVVLPDAAPSGSYPVLAYGSITGAGNLTSNYRNTNFTGGANTATINVGASMALIWTGAVDDVWETKGVANWKNVSNAPQSFHWGDPVHFDDGGLIAPVVQMSGELRPASVTISADLIDYTLQGSGTLTGPMTLTKSGDGWATLSGVHSFTGGITVNDGLLRPSGNQSLGAVGQSITVNSGGTLDTNGAMNANRDYQAVIAGTGSLGTGAIINSGATHNNGFGSLTLSGNATIGGTGRWDVRPAVAGNAFVDLGGFTLTKSGPNYIGFVDGFMSADGDILIWEGTLGITRMNVSGAGTVQITNNALLQFENNTTGSWSKAISVDNSRIRLQGSNYTVAAGITAVGDATLDIEDTRTLTVTGAVTGSGNLVKSAATGTLVLAGTNTYAGTTTINAGTLTIGSQSSLGTLGAGAVTNNGALVITRPDAAYVVSNEISGSGTLTIGQASGGAFDALVTLTGNNSFTGNVAIASGGLKIFSASALGTGTKTVTLNNGTAGRPQFYLDGSGGDITLPSTVSFVTSSTNSSQPAIGNLGGNNVVAGPITLTSGGGSTAVSVFGGTLSLNGNISANTSNRRLILGGTSGSGTVNGIIANGTNPVGVDKVGTVTWTLAGNNNYTGTTDVLEGTLLVNGSQGAASGAVTVASGATLGGTGTVGGSINAAAGSTIAPGVGIGTLTTTAPVTLGGSLAVEMNAGTADRINVDGSLTITGATLAVTALAAPTQPAYVIASYGALTGTFGTVTGLPAGYTVNYNYNGLNQIAIVQGGNAYGSWETANGIGGAGSNVDSDGDGIANGIEFVIGGIPSGPGSNSSALLPTITTDATYLNFVFRRTDESATYSPYVEYGTTLAGWTQAQNGVSGVIIVEDNDFFGGSVDRVTVRIPRALAGPGAKLFARLRVDIP